MRLNNNSANADLAVEAGNGSGDGLPGGLGVDGPGNLVHPGRTVKTEPRIDNLLVVRESDEGAKLLMEVMIQRTCLLRPDIPGCREMAAAGLDPLLHPDRYGASEVRKGRNRSVLFTRDGTMFFFWMGSAASINTPEGENLFSNYLVEVIRRFRPRSLYVAAFTRLVRSGALSKDLGRVCQELRVTIHYPGGTIEPWTPMGEALWAFQTTFASMERNEIVNRNLLGMIASGMRGGCPFGPKGLPPGYLLDKDRVRPVESMRTEVGRMLLILADPTLSYTEAAARLGECGIRRPLLAFGSDLNAADARDPATVIRSLLKWTDLYETGTWTMQRKNPLPGLDLVGPIVVQRDEDGDPGTLSIPFQWGLPDGGWAPPEVFSLLRARQQLDSERSAREGGGSTGSRPRKPFAGLCEWSDDEWDWHLDTNGDGLYRLRRRRTVTVPESTNGKPGWADSTTTGDVVDRFTCKAFHEAFVDAVVEALATGVPGVLEEGFVIELERAMHVVRTDGATVLADIDGRINDARLRIRRCLDLAAADEHLADELLEAAGRAKKELRRLEKERERHVAAVSAPASPVVRTDADHVARVLAALAAVDGVTDGVVGEALKVLLLDLRFGDRLDGTRAFTFRLRLPAEGGLFELGPITGRVPVKDQPHPSVASRGGKAAVAKRIDDLLRQGTGAQAILDELRISPTYLRNAATGLLAGTPVTRHALNCLIGAPIDELRSTVWSQLRRGAALPERVTPGWVDTALLPDGVSAEWAAHTMNVYLGVDRPITRPQWAISAGLRTDAVAHTLAVGGTTTLAELSVAIRHALTRPKIAVFTEYDPCGATWMPVLVRVGDWDRDSQHRRLAPTNQVSCVTCPHCAALATKVIQVPEATRNLLCAGCGRMPEPNSPVFPEPYLLLPDRLTTTTAPRFRTGRKSSGRITVSDDTVAQVIADYTAGVPILGSDGIVSRHSINTQRLYRILDANDVPRRSPRNSSRTGGKDGGG
jgi:hypothetical protein